VNTIEGDPVRAETTFDGIPASAGIVIAPVHVVLPDIERASEGRELEPFEIEMEIERFREAVERADRMLEQIERMTREQVNDRAEIFEALRMLLHDPILSQSVIATIEGKRVSAHAAIVAETESIAAKFTAASDEMMRSRAEDIRALQSHLIACLSQSTASHPVHAGTVLVLSSLSPGDAVIHARNKVGAFVVQAGGINSHAAILARAFGIPMVAGVPDIFRHVRQNDTVIVDGYIGRVVLDPSADTIGQYRQRKEGLEAQRRKYREIRDLPAETRDGERIVLATNLDMIDEIEGAIENGAGEIGLMRTEFLMMGRAGDIGMEEQYEYYRQVAERAYPMMVTLRAFDIGSDKLIGDMWGHDGSPLGLRGTRLLLSRPEILRRQIEAVLRASTMKNLRLLLPMVTSIEEIRQVKRMVAETRAKLRSANVRFDEYMPIGAMIETPAAALTAEILAGECAFLSIGTNDLAQYTLAVDRGDEAMSEYYDEFHPAVLHLVRSCLLAAQRAGVPITLCGEMAANPLATGVLVGLGLRRFSVAPSQLGPLKMRVRSITAQEARAWARAAIRMPTAADVRSYLASCVGGGDSSVNIET
jgi:phosphotransferase system enzyme I (PtsI)